MSIMNEATSDPETILKLNECRIATKVYYLQDILSIDGTDVLPDAYKGNARRSTWRWLAPTIPKK